MSRSCSQTDQTKEVRWGRSLHLTRVEEGRSALKMLTGTPTGKRPLGRPRHKSEDNIRMYFKEIGINTSNLVDSAQDRDYWRVLVNSALNLWVQ